MLCKGPHCRIPSPLGFQCTLCGLVKTAELPLPFGYLSNQNSWHGKSLRASQAGYELWALIPSLVSVQYHFKKTWFLNHKNEIKNNRRRTVIKCYGRIKAYMKVTSSWPSLNGDWGRGGDLVATLQLEWEPLMHWMADCRREEVNDIRQSSQDIVELYRWSHFVVGGETNLS